MFKYILKRIVVFIPTLLIISLMAFIISISAPGDPVERLLRAADSEGGTSEQSSAVAQQRQELRQTDKAQIQAGLFDRMVAPGDLIDLP